MPVASPRARLTQCAVLAVTGATALAVAACGSSNNTNSASSTSSTAPTSSPSASAKGKDWVVGQIASVSGDAIQVTQQSGAATVDFSPSTKITQITLAKLTDVTTGSCIAVRPTNAPAGGGPITALAVRLSPAVDGKCPEPKQPAGAAGGPAGRHFVLGTVGSVAGNTITVNETDATGKTTPTAVTVNDTTKYSKQSATDAQGLAQGRCIAARGTKDDSGTLQATAISVSPADNGNCPQQGGKRRPH
jgi:hypothetical protein